MLDKSSIKKRDKVAFSMLKTADQLKRISHAYLFEGSKGSQVYEFAILTLQSIVCLTKDLFACQKCLECQRIERLNYGDLMVLDGRTKLITKDQVIQIINQLQQTPIEKQKKKLLLILNVENTNKYSLNSLLKFIEEPTKNTFIIMTTNNLNDVLTTIRSRAQVIHLNPKSVTIFKNQLIKNHVPKRYATVLASVYDEYDVAKDAYDNLDFITDYKKIIALLKEIIKSHPLGRRALIGLIKKSSNYLLFLKLIEIFFNDIWKYQSGITISFVSETKLLSNFIATDFDYKKAIELIYIFKKALSKNANFDLTKEKFAIQLLEE